MASTSIQAKEKKSWKELSFAGEPILLPLDISDLAPCLQLENAAFVKPQHRCSPEKVAQHNEMFPKAYRSD
jgi:hypothetical protein